MKGREYKEIDKLETDKRRVIIYDNGFGFEVIFFKFNRTRRSAEWRRLGSNRTKTLRKAKFISKSFMDTGICYVTTKKTGCK